MNSEVKQAKQKEVREKELMRLQALWEFENLQYSKGSVFVGGIDEAGRGPLAGPVSAACVILPKGIMIEGLNDSKKLTHVQREHLYEEITSCAVSWGVAMVDPDSIDRINILNATKLAMCKAVESMSIKPDFLLVDALLLGNISIKQQNIIKGDCKSASIAAASIIAKVTRDRLLEKMDLLYPVYGFVRNKGYGTAEHIAALKKYGPCPIHRRSFIGNFVEESH